MSSYAVIAEVSKKLRSVLWDAFDRDPVIRTIVDNEAEIVFSNPTETARQDSNQLSIWLYQITEDEFVKNQMMLRGNTPDQQRFPPLALNLFYLITPFAGGDADHLILGKSMQVFYDNALMTLRNDAMEISEELRLIFCRLTLEELTRIWESLQEPYRLSVCYQVRVTTIESERTPGAGRVTEWIGDYRQHSPRFVPNGQ